MILRLVWRSLVRKPGRSLLLLSGWALGVGVTVTLLAIGTALLESSRDVELVGGGDLTVLPAGLDLETFRTGGVSSLYFTVEQAPFLYRQVLTGPRFDGQVAAAAPWTEDQLVYLEVGGEARAVAADGVIPGRAAALGVEPRVLEGSWSDLPADRRWTSPSDSALYAEMDAFHLPPPEAAGDSTWAEWHYFNVMLPDGRGWLYLTFTVAGEVPDGRWGGRLLATLVERQAGVGEADGWRVRTFRREVPSERVTFSTGRPDLAIGGARVALGPEGLYRVTAAVPPAGGERAGGTGRATSGGDAGVLRVDLEMRPDPGRYLPPLQVAEGAFPSGYTVPVLRGRASGRVCVDGDCRRLDGERGYHDHNWGVWRDVTWEWGEADAGPYGLVYGGVRRGDEAAGGPGFLFLTDSLGFAGLLPVRRVEVRRRPGSAADASPEALRVLARRDRDSLLLRVEVRQASVSRRPEGTGPGAADLFHQLHGILRLEGRLGGEAVAARGSGFFETWTRARDRSGRGGESIGAAGPGAAAGSDDAGGSGG